MKTASAAQGDLFAGVPAPVRPTTPADERDAALALLERTRSKLIASGRVVADQLWRRNARVTSVEVFEEMRKQGFGPLIDSVDGRWMGAVFARGFGWKRLGYEPTGSHARPVAIWGKP